MTRVEGLQDMLFISDLDGTLFGPEGKLSSRVINSLNRMIEKGLRFTAATARSPASAIPLLSALNLHEPVMLMNGVLIYDLQSARYLNVEAMSRESTSALIAAMRQHNLRGFLYLLDKLLKNHIFLYMQTVNSPAVFHLFQLQALSNFQFLNQHQKFVF